MKSKQLILLGPPGVGVKDHAIALSKSWNVPHVSMGQLMRGAIAKESAIGLEMRPYVESKELVPDALAMKLLRRRFEQPDVMLNGWVLDGFPRTLAQAKAFDEWLLKVGHPAAQVAYLKSLTGLLIKQLMAQPGQTEPISAMRQRLNLYKEETAPLIEYYQQRDQLTMVNANQSVAEVGYALSELGQQEDAGAALFIRDESELDSLLQKEPLLVVDCMASWCGSCKLVTPLIDQLAEAYGERANVMKIDFDANQQVPKRFGLKGMPAVMFFKGGELVETLTGVKPYQTYSSTLTRFLE